MMKFMRVLALSFVLMLSLCLIAAAQTEFITGPLSEEEYRTASEKVEFVFLDSAPQQWPVNCFDVREDHWLLVCSERMTTKVIAVYDENNVFQYGFKTDWNSDCAAGWYGDDILFYSVRGSTAWILNENAQIVDIRRVALTHEKGPDIRETMLATSRTVENITYTMTNDNPLTAILSGSYAYIEKSENETVTVMYNAKNIQRIDSMVKPLLLSVLLVMVGLMVWVGIRQTVRARLSSVSLSREQLTTYIRTQGVLLDIHDTVPSTNATAKALAANGAAEGTVVLAAAQTAGRGRLGRTFCSPDSTGVYMSLILRPQLPAENALFITVAAAVAVCRALERLGAATPRIKWVNDVYCRDRKVCGILTEAATNPVTGELSYVVLGIGINVTAPKGGFPAELAHIAGAAFSENAPSREQVIAAVIDAFFAEYAHLEDGAFIDEYRARSMLGGRAVTVITPTSSREATALGVDERCRLLVRYADGSEETLSSGDVSLRL